jgi:hypothetical protein
MLHVRESHRPYPDVWRHVAILAAAPAVEGVVYTVGMTVDLGQPIAAGSRCTGGVVVESAVAAINTSGGSVAVLQVQPATSTELAWSRVHGTTALREQWAAQEIDLLDLGRGAMNLG